MPLITPPNADSAEYRADLLRQKVRTTLDEAFRHVRTAYEALNQQFTPTRNDGRTASQLTPAEAYEALGEDAGQLRAMRQAMRDFLNAASPGAGDLPEDQHKLAFGESTAPKGVVGGVPGVVGGPIDVAVGDGAGPERKVVTRRDADKPAR